MVWCHLEAESKEIYKLVNIAKKKQTHRESTRAYQLGEGGGIHIGLWEAQSIGCKIGYKDVMYNTRNIASIL